MDVIIKCGGYNYAEVLAAHARLLNVRRLPWPLPPFYHMLSDSLVWIDEALVWWKSPELFGALSLLCHYRTGLILGEPRPYRELWELGRRLFPLWRGFRPGRCQRSWWLTKIYRGGCVDADRRLDELCDAIDELCDGSVSFRVIPPQVGDEPCGASP